MKKTILFDMDGLMFDTEYLTFKCSNTIIQSYGFDPMKLEEYAPCAARPICIFKNMILKKYNNQIDPDRLFIETYEFRMKWQKENGIPLKKGLLELIEYAHSHSIKMAVVSGSERYIVDDALNFHHIKQHFDSIICGDEVVNRKPHLEGFLKAAKALQVDVSEVFVLEDSETGIEASNNGNMDVICIPDLKYPDPEQQQMCYKICSDLKEVMDVFGNNQ